MGHTARGKTRKAIRNPLATGSCTPMVLPTQELWTRHAAREPWPGRGGDSDGHRRVTQGMMPSVHCA